MISNRPGIGAVFSCAYIFNASDFIFLNASDLHLES